MRSCSKPLRLKDSNPKMSIREMVPPACSFSVQLFDIYGHRQRCAGLTIKWLHSSNFTKIYIYEQQQPPSYMFPVDCVAFYWDMQKNKNSHLTEWRTSNKTEVQRWFLAESKVVNMKAAVTSCTAARAFDNGIGNTSLPPKSHLTH